MALQQHLPTRAPLSTAAEEDLSEEEIQRLLQEAEDRLRASSDVANLENTGVEKVTRKTLPRLSHSIAQKPYIEEKNGVAQVDSARLVDQFQRKHAQTLRSADITPTTKKMNDQVSAGADWFDLPKTALTPQLKRDFQLLEMRAVLDPHRHYKKDSRKGKLPAFSQVGTVIQGPTEWYSSRINNKDRAKNFVEETMAVEKESGRFKRKYEDIQGAKTSGKKAHYKGLLAKRKSRR